MFEIGLQVLVVVLLGVTLVYAVLLNRRLARLRDGREEMQLLTEKLGVTMAGAENGVANLRRTAFEDDDALGRRIAEARTARDEIGFLVDRAETLAARLEVLIGNGRDAERMAPTSMRAKTTAAVDDDGESALFADAPAAAVDADADAARAARATATAWLRSRAPSGAATDDVGAAPLRALR